MSLFKVLLDDFSQLNEIPELTIENQRCQLMVDAKLVVCFQMNEDSQLHMYSTVGMLVGTTAQQLTILDLIGRANYLGLGTNGLTLSLAPVGNQVVLSGCWPIVVLNKCDLTCRFEQFIQTAEYWQSKLAVFLQHNPENTNSTHDIKGMRI